MGTAVAEKGTTAANTRNQSEEPRAYTLTNVLDEVGSLPVLRGEELLRPFAIFHRGRRAAEELAELIPYSATDIRRWARLKHEDLPLPDELSDLWAEVKKAGRRAKRLLLEVQAGEEAFLTIYRHNIRLVSALAKKYQAYATLLTLEELYQEGLFGLETAIERFDPANGAAFSTYAHFQIRAAIQKALDTKDRAVRVYNENSKHTQPVSLLSLDHTIDDEDQTRFGDFFAADTPGTDPEQNSEEQDLRERVWTILQKIGSVHAVVLGLNRGYFDGRPRSIVEIAKGTGWSRDRVGLILAEARERFRYIAEREGLDVYLE